MKTLLLLLTLSHALFAINVADAAQILKAQTSLPQAQTKAQKEHKPIIMLLVIKEGCHWCELMVKETLGSRMIQNALGEMVVLITEQHSALAKHYGATATPAVYFLESQTGKVLYEQLGYEKPGSFLINIRSAEEALTPEQ